MNPPDAPDPLDLLMRQPVPPPTPARRAETLRAANLAFREKVHSPPQANSWIKRLFGSAAEQTAAQPRETGMTLKGLLRGTALALAGLIAISTTADYLKSPSYSSQTSSSPSQFSQISADSMSNSVASSPEPTTAQSLRPLTDSATENTTSTSGAVASFQPPAEAPAQMERQRGEDSASAPTARTEQDSAVSAMPLLRATPNDDKAVINNNEDPLESFRPQVPEATMPAQSVAPSLMPWIPEEFRPTEQYTSGTDSFSNRADNPMVSVEEAPVSTFSADTDTAGYATVRRMLQSGQLPPPEAVRTEEMVNYFDYDYATSHDQSRPFEPTVAVYPTPWNATTQLLHIGIKAYTPAAMAERPPVNLVLLIDVSGSMGSTDRLPLVKRAFGMLINQLSPTDTISIVTYAGSSGIALPPTHVENKQRILEAIDSLSAGGSTAGAAGLATAYELAKQNYNKEGVNRILLTTDGDFNVGVSAPNGLAQYVAAQRSSGILLSVLGFGMGNYQDTTMQAIAQNGNGVAAYIDSISEARRVLSDQLTGTLFTVAKDVKFQVEFNPAQVKSYRLLGYETRALRREDFNNDKVDAGEVGAGHEVTAIYEVEPVTGGNTTVPESRYAATAATKPEPIGMNSELAFLRIRYKLPNETNSNLIERPVTVSDILPDITAASSDIRFAAAVTGFSRLLRHSDGMGHYGLNDVLQAALAARGNDSDGTRTEFADLVRTAIALGGLKSNPQAPAEDGGVAYPPQPLSK